MSYGHETETDLPKLFELWASPMTFDEVQKALGVSHSKLYRLAKRHKLPLRARMAQDRKNAREPDPTAEEIAQRAAEIRAGWSEQEHERRAGKRTAMWEAPEYVYEANTSTFAANP